MSDTSYPVFQHYGTAAERASFTASPPASGQPIYLWYETDTGNTYLYDTGWHFIGGSTAAGGPIIPAARLTTETGVSVSSSDRTAQGTIYWTPYNGNQIKLYNGSSWRSYTLTEKSLALTATSGKNYDVFAYDNSGTITLELSAAWTDDNTRADALALQDGMYVKSGATTRLWIGTIRASAANVTADAQVSRFVWNAFNQVPRSLYNESGSAHNYNTATWRYFNNDTTEKVEFVVGSIDRTVNGNGRIEFFTNSGSVGALFAASLNWTSGSPLTREIVQNNESYDTSIVEWNQTPLLGYNFIAYVEYGTGATATFNGYSGNPMIWN